MNCEKGECTRYSDIDVWYADGSCKAMCAEHAWNEKDTVQLIPQHGSDDINKERVR